MTHLRALSILLACALLAGCASGPPRRVSEPAASIQQLTVRADGGWTVDLRLQNYSSLPMRFEQVTLEVSVAGEAAGTLQAQPGLTIGPESADVVSVPLTPSAGARMRMADALASGRGIAYRLEGSLDAAPEDRARSRTYTIERNSQLSPVPGLAGVLR
ncbi:LEA type 2 family protein [Luteimonas vadosa]|uniref:LEA type 2 family protein n=1 Tax=Luteimonas vadosa TaxID=1165507 RepID=A0ABP9DX68_9GAMM